MKCLGKLTLALAALGTVPAWGQDLCKPEKAGLVRLSDLSGKTVRMHDGRELGTVKDVVVDLQRGRAVFAAVARKEDSKQILAVPVTKFRQVRSEDGKKLDSLKIEDEKVFAEAPSATQDEWDRTDDRAMLARLAGKSEGIESMARANSVMKASVIDANGDRLGEIDEIMVNLENSRLLALVGVGGVLGIGERRHVVPWEILRIREQKKDGPASFTLSVPKDRLEKGPILGKDEENRLSDPSWIAGLYDHYQYGPLGGGREAIRVVTAEKLIGADVASTSKPDDAFGEIEGLAIVPHTGKIAYVGFEVDGKLYAVPLDAFNVSWDKKNLKVVIDADKAKFKSMRSFKENRWPERADAGWKEGLLSDREEPRESDGVPMVLRSSDVLDAAVKDARRVTFGEIENFAVDLDSAHVLYVIVGTGGFLGIAETMYAIPWKALKWSGDKDQFFTVNAERKTLERSVEFDAKRRSDLGYIRSVYGVYGLECEPKKFGGKKMERTQP